LLNFCIASSSSFVVLFLRRLHLSMAALIFALYS
jgi:hypothetical protein